jgi:eukaryotic-like serine/threonine-protein kinase
MPMFNMPPELWKLLSPLLDELLELPAATRSTRLAELRHSTPDVASDLDRLLAAHQQAQQHGFMTGAAHAAPMSVGPAPSSLTAASAPPSALDTSASLAGQRLGAYVLQSPLGQGGGGSVWRARREDGRYEGEVAVKLLHLSLVGRTGAERFKREGQILARLQHPNIARLLDAGVSETGQPYLVLDLVEGERIDHHCNTRRLTLAQRLALFDDVLAAVADAHTHGVIHRDLKPSNILVTQEGSVKLLDFGVAKLLDDEASNPDATELTHQGAAGMTPTFAAPEQLRGEGVTTATDVYALGVLLYQLLAGQHPTAGAANTAADVMRSTLESEPVKLSRCVVDWERDKSAEWANQRSSTFDRLRMAFLGDLDTITARALKKNPLERYPTAAALAEDLRRYRTHEPVLAQPDALAYRARKFVRRNRGAVVAVTLIASALLAGLGGTMWQGQRALEAAQQARLERDRARTELNHAQAAQELLSFMVSDGSGKALTTSELLDRTQASVEKGFAKQPLERARLLLMLGSQRGELAQIEKGRLALQGAHSAAVQAGNLALQANIDCILGHMHGLQGEFVPAREKIDAAIQRLGGPRVAESGGAAVPFESSDAAAAKAQCLNTRVLLSALTATSPREAEADAREALRLQEVSGVGKSAQGIQLRAALASALRMQGRRAEAIEQLKLALGELDALGRGQTARAATMWNNLGAALTASGQTQPAVEAMRTSLALNEAVTGSDHDPVALSNLAQNLAQQGQLDEALGLLRKAWQQASADKSPRVLAEVSLRLAAVAISAGLADEAAARLNQTGQLFDKLLKPDHPSVAMHSVQSARLALLNLQPAQSQPLLATAQEVLDKTPVEHPGRFRVRIERARAAQALGDASAAQRWAEQALQQAQHFSQGFASSDYLAEAHLLLGELAAARGQAKLASQQGQEALRHHQASAGPASAVVLKTKALVDRWSSMP